MMTASAKYLAANESFKACMDSMIELANSGDVDAMNIASEMQAFLAKLDRKAAKK